ncbi:TPA: hypothetical protein KDY89_004371 [Vibrio parahaemolyticus]|nr:hypothetical protein [Vibrio parahaemolyticus]
MKIHAFPNSRELPSMQLSKPSIMLKPLSLQSHYALSSKGVQVRNDKGFGNPTYDRTVVKKAIELSSEAYSNDYPKGLSPKELGIICHKENYPTSQEHFYFRNGVYSNGFDTEFIVSRDDVNNKLYVAFRGTEREGINFEGKDLKTDLTLMLKNHPRVTQGIEEPLKGIDAYARKNDLDLVITGHSLGGAIVNRLSERRLGPANATYIAYSSPIFSRGSNVLNLGFESDPIYGLLSQSTYHNVASNLIRLAFDEPAHLEGNSLQVNSFIGSMMGKNIESHSTSHLNELVDSLFLR